MVLKRHKVARVGGLVVNRDLGTGLMGNKGGLVSTFVVEKEGFATTCTAINAHLRAVRVDTTGVNVSRRWRAGVLRPPPRKRERRRSPRRGDSVWLMPARTKAPSLALGLRRGASRDGRAGRGTLAGTYG